MDFKCLCGNVSIICKNAMVLPLLSTSSNEACCHNLEKEPSSLNFRQDSRDENFMKRTLHQIYKINTNLLVINYKPLWGACNSVQESALGFNGYLFACALLKDNIKQKAKEEKGRACSCRPFT